MLSGALYRKLCYEQLGMECHPEKYAQNLGVSPDELLSTLETRDVSSPSWSDIWADKVRGQTQ
jgi:hypothetical protein